MSRTHNTTRRRAEHLVDNDLMEKRRESINHGNTLPYSSVVHVWHKAGNRYGNNRKTWAKDKVYDRHLERKKHRSEELPVLLTNPEV